jgi:fructan beta-fructosidase
MLAGVPAGLQRMNSCNDMGRWISHFLTVFFALHSPALCHGAQTDVQPPQLLANVKREFKIQQRYLNIPIKNGAPKRKVTTLVDGKVQVSNDIELADAKPDWWAFMDVSAWRGKILTLEADNLPADSTALSSVEQSDSIKGAENLYREPLRGQFHFSSRRGWNNDPNGLVFFKGEYHLFYQHNPYGWAWGNMHWGHAVSSDLVHWKELGDVLAPDELGPMFSGSAVVDWQNTSGLGQPGRPPQVLIYTAAGNPFVQCIASSVDGRTYAKFSGNPVVQHIAGGNRDPKVMWYGPGNKWVMVLYVDLNGANTIHFLSSPNLKDWTVMSRIESFAECPDFFQLPVDGEASNQKWVLTGASSEYMVGVFDGTTFMPETTKLPGHQGSGFYAAQTFSDIPAKDGRRIRIGWLQTATPGMPFNQSMSLPMELKLTATSEGARLTWTPVKELQSLRIRSWHFGPATLGPESANPLAEVRAELVELRAEFEPGDASEVAFNVRGATIVYDAKKQEVCVNNHRAPAPLRGGKQQLRIYCDRTALEVFASDGLTYVPMPFQPRAEDLSLGIHVKGASTKFTVLEVHELKSAWR